MPPRSNIDNEFVLPGKLTFMTTKLSHSSESINLSVVNKLFLVCQKGINSAPN